MAKLVVIVGIALAAIATGLAVALLLSHNQVPVTASGQTVIKKVTLLAEERKLLIAPDSQLHPGGIWYNAMTFNGTIPGPIISVNLGDALQITLVNHDDIVHSLNLHAGTTPNDTLSGVVSPAANKTLTIRPQNAGFFMYHCDGDNLNGIWEHIASGMYGGMLVRPANQAQAKEFYVAFGEVYNSADRGLFEGANGTGSFDMEKFIQGRPDLVLTNGMAHKYVPFLGGMSKIILNAHAGIFKVKPGELTRWYIVNAGPRDYLSFNFSPSPVIVDSYNSSIASTDGIIAMPPGSARAFETTFSEPGYYFGNDHDIGHMLMGAGFLVLATNDSNSTDFPAGSGVPR